MTKLPFDHEKITQKDLDESVQKDETGRKNKKARELFKILMASRGFGGKLTTAVYTDLVYEYKEPEKQNPLAAERKTHRSSGDNRLENLLRGHVGFAEKEAVVWHKALRHGFGDEWADKFTPMQFATMSPEDFLMEALASDLPWPDDRISPLFIMEVLAGDETKQKLSIAPAFLDAPKLGTEAESANADLLPIEKYPKYKAGAKYQLSISGLKANEERVLYVELSHDNLSFAGGNEVYYAFPIAIKNADSANMNIRPDGEYYEIADIVGSFGFFAIAFPKDLNEQDAFDLDFEDERITPEDFRAFLLQLRKLMIKMPSSIRIASHLYCV